MFFDQSFEHLVFGCGATLLIDRSVVVVGGHVTTVVEFLVAVAVGTRGEAEVGAPVNHVHGIRVAIVHEKPILLLVFGYLFRLPWLTPMSEPSGVDLPTEEHACFLELLDVVELDLGDGVVDANISTNPMAFLDVFYPIDVVLVAGHIEVEPYLPNGFYICFFIPIEAILILYL
jgi:hypothetical protein